MAKFGESVSIKVSVVKHLVLNVMFAFVSCADRHGSPRIQGFCQRNG